MIVDLKKFMDRRRGSWRELERLLDRFEREKGSGWTVVEIQELNTMYRAACSDLAQAQTFASNPEMVSYLEALVARGYGVVHRRKTGVNWVAAIFEWPGAFPRAFRKRIRTFAAATAVLLLGAFLGAFLVAQDGAAKEMVFGVFGHLLGDPSDRVALEEANAERAAGAHHATFSGQLMTNNIRVSILAMSFGMLWGIPTVMLLFYNGAILGGVCYDYIRAGEGEFLAAWLLPHGVVEIPAILLGGMAGFMLAQAMIGWGDGRSLGDRFRAIRKDLGMIVGGFVVLLIWAGLVESYLSQTHEPVISYSTKIGIGLVELALLVMYLFFGGRKRRKEGSR